MKKILLLLLMSVLIVGCEKEDLDSQKNIVSYEVSCNTLDVPVRLNSMVYSTPFMTIKNYWKSGDYETAAYVVGMKIFCDDPDALITCKIYVNGKLRKQVDGNSYVAAGYEVKKRN